VYGEGVDAFTYLVRLAESLRAHVKCVEHPEGGCIGMACEKHSKGLEESLKSAERFVARVRAEKARAPS
jgi:hypothetical protein